MTSFPKIAGAVLVAIWATSLVVVASSAPQSPAGSAGWNIPKDATALVSPIPVTSASIAKGKTLFQSRCARCHGTNGTGRGPDAEAAHPPSDLSDPARSLFNPDGVLFYKIWNGRAKPKMPAMKSDMSASEAWMLVEYVKTLRRQ